MSESQLSNSPPKHAGDSSQTLSIADERDVFPKETLSIVTKVPASAPPPRPPVLYKVEYLDKHSDAVFTKEDNQPIRVQSTLDTVGKSILEVITKVQIVGAYDEKLNKEPLSEVTIDSTSLKINSPAIITALKTVVGVYPGQNWMEDSITIPEPFAILVHHEEELRSYRGQFSPGKAASKDEVCERKGYSYEHLTILQDFLHDRIGASVEAERQRHKRGVATFEMLWLLLKPGQDIYYDTEHEGHLSAYVIESVTGGVSRGRPSLFEIRMWYLDYDGAKVGRQSRLAHQYPFDGEKEITSLEAFPCEYSKDATSLRKQLERRGEMFFRLTKRQCMSYNGFTISFPRKHVSASEVAYASFPVFLLGC